eukprot:GFYU01018433.1.p1 GENE.GFYU01018433.1~~GFYU01018433.1.p1  ORF type:complete len:209 (+),score=51.82 GFYU01018433.1:18-644(+)
MAAIEKAITDKTRAIITCSPNNPTGRIYSSEKMAELGALLNKINETRPRPIFCIVDTVYARVVFNNERDCMFNYCTHSFLVSSYSKDLSLAGERVGYIVVNPKCPKVDALMGAFGVSNRILGIVNCNATLQRAIALCPDAVVDINWYKSRCEAAYQILKDAGIECLPPQGGFYLFPKVPAGVSDEKWLSELTKRNILVIPGECKCCNA